MKRKILAYFLKVFSRIVLKKYQPKVIAVVGSVGKTSTKEAIYCALRKDFKVLKNELNLNTEIGVPLTILLGQDAKRNIFLWLVNFLKALRLIIFPCKNYPEILILEMSEDRERLLNYLFKLTQPEIAVLSWIGEIPVHLENYSSLERFKKEIISFFAKIKENGLVVLNKDNYLFEEISKKVKAKIISYGFSPDADFCASNYKLSLKENNEIEMSFRLEHQNSFLPVRVRNIFSKNQVYALLSALAIGQYFGLNILEIAQNLEEYQTPKGRLHLIEGVNNTLILDDSYNANPDSVLSALETFNDLYQLFKEKRSLKRKIVILGDMLELGEMSELAHKKVGEKVKEIADIFVSIGEKMKIASEIFLKEKGEDKVFIFENSLEARKRIKEIIFENDFILVKGSRGMHMELITQSLMANPKESNKYLIFDSPT